MLNDLYMLERAATSLQLFFAVMSITFQFLIASVTCNFLCFCIFMLIGKKYIIIWSSDPTGRFMLPKVDREFQL